MIMKNKEIEIQQVENGYVCKLAGDVETPRTDEPTETYRDWKRFSYVFTSWDDVTNWVKDNNIKE